MKSLFTRSTDRPTYPTAALRNLNAFRALKSEFTEEARAIRLHKDGKVLRIRGAARGVVDHEVGGPQVEARVAVEDAEGPQEGAMPLISRCVMHGSDSVRVRARVCAPPLTRELPKA